MNKNIKTPLEILRKTVFGPLYRFHRDYLSRNARHNNIYKPIANFIFERSKEMPVIMLGLNAISTLSSHISQINGLRKSKRENKDYLITQEFGELGFDLALSIIPPFILNNYLTKKLDSGVWTTKSARKHLLDTIIPTVGATEEELYNIDHIIPFKENLRNTKNSILLTLKKKNKIPKNLLSRLNIQEPDLNKKIPIVRMEQITTDFDIIRKNKYKGFYNGSAYSEINGQRNGLLVMAAIGYTIVVSNIVLPILKNKFSNYMYNKQLKKMGETKESIKRKKRYNNLAQTAEVKNEENIFNIFSNSDNTITQEKILDRSIYSSLMYERFENKNVFNEVNNFSRISSQSNGLRI